MVDIIVIIVDRIIRLLTSLCFLFGEGTDAEGGGGIRPGVYALLQAVVS
jgi:hypothetical protein